MISAGKIVLFRFPQTDQSQGKLRPALAIRRLPGKYDDWLICMISTQVSQQIQDLDDIIRPEDDDFKNSGLKALSLFRVSRLAVVEKSILLGILGEISDQRMIRIKSSLSNWIKGS
jgi:mRNA interferase MazF